MTEITTQQYILGETSEDIIVNTRDDIRLLSVALAEQAQRSIDIFSQDLDQDIYNNRPFEQALFRLVKQHPSTSVRILCYDIRPALTNGHCLIRLAQSLTSSVFIHQPSKEHEGLTMAYMIADRCGLALRKNAVNQNQTCTVNFNDAQQSITLSETFEEIWQHSRVDTNVRRLYL
jgi:hypothetical protein